MPIALLDERDKEELQEQINGKVGKDEFEELSDPNRHAEYFTVSKKGVLALKPEYRGKADGTTYPDSVSDKGVGVAGSRNAELPKRLAIPEIVGEVAVDSIADGAFQFNNVIKIVEFPKTIKHIPKYCFNRSLYLEEVMNIEHITTIGERAFDGTAVKSMNLPNLTSLGVRAFAQCSRLTHINLGKITTISDRAFFRCYSLSRVTNDSAIKTISQAGFMWTHNLLNANFVKDATSIGSGAFVSSSFEYDWNSLTSCTFGNNATAKQINPTDIWSECTITACSNPIPTLLSQDDERWSAKQIGTSAKNYGSGCQFFDVMYCYSGFYNKSFSAVEEFEAEMSAKAGANHINTYANGWADIKPFAEPLGLSVTEYSAFNKTNLQTLYNALAEGKYAILPACAGNPNGTMTGHTVLAYGITADGKLKILDSGKRYYNDGSLPRLYELPFKVLCDGKLSQAICFVIVGKA